MIFDNGPVVDRESYNREPSPGEGLLIDKSLVAGNEHLKAVLFGPSQQFTIGQSTPSQVRSGDDLVAAERNEVRSQLVREIVVEQNFQGVGCTRCE